MTRLKRRTANVKRAEGTRAGVARRGRATAAPRLRHSSDEAARRDRAKQGHARSRGCALVGGHTGQGAGELTRGVPGEGGRVTEVGAPGRGGVPSGGGGGSRPRPHGGLRGGRVGVRPPPGRGAARGPPRPREGAPGPGCCWGGAPRRWPGHAGNSRRTEGLVRVGGTAHRAPPWPRAQRAGRGRGGDREEREGAYHGLDERQQPLSGDPSEGRERVGERRKRERGSFSLPSSWVHGKGEVGVLVRMEGRGRLRVH
jgi:hypothetical protein